MADYDTDVFVNGKWLRKFFNEEERQVVEISNILNWALIKSPDGQKRKATENPSPAHYLEYSSEQADEREKHHGHGVVGGLSPNGCRGR